GNARACAPRAHVSNACGASGCNSAKFIGLEKIAKNGRHGRNGIIHPHIGAAVKIVIFGLSITSSWGNGHATTYRALARALHQRGHRVRFFERDMPWYADNRDLPDPKYCEVRLYSSIAELQEYFPADIQADLIILGSFVPQG